MKVYKINWCVTWGVLAAAAGTLLVVTWPTLFHLQLRRIMSLTNGSFAFNLWQELPLPVYAEFYLYNISNVDDILAGKNVKLKVQQMGPYVFIERQKKVNIEWNANSTVTYLTKRTWYFQPELSNGSLSDIVTNINPLIPSIDYILRYDNIMMRTLANMLVSASYSNMFISGSVSTWLFDGFDSNILSIATKIPSLPYYVPYDRIAWLYTRNNSAEYDGWYVVNTGEEDFSRLGKIERWKHINQTVFPGQCGEVRGSTGEVWALKKDQPEISFFAPDLLTSLTLAASGPVTIRGIEGMLFVSNDSIFDNGQKYSSKACYCKYTPDECMVSGALNASLRAFGAPLFITLPHFRHVDPYYANKVDGLEPTEDHDLKVAIEPVSGMPLMVKGQIQANVLVRHSSWMRMNNQLPDPDTLVPMVWLRETAFVDDKYARFARIVLKIKHTLPYVFYALTIKGVVLLLAGLWIMIIKCPKERTSSELAETDTFLPENNECN